MKVNRNVHELFLCRPLIADALDEAAHTPPRMEFPLKGFHTLYETQFESADGYAVTWAWVVGGRNDGLRYTIGVARKEAEILTGWERGHRDYVFLRTIPEGLASAIERLSSQKLLLIGELPFFNDYGVHRDGWHSNGLFATKIDPVKCIKTPVPSCADEELVLQPECWRIKEGVYILFPDNTYRLMSREGYQRMAKWNPPDHRQGDLLVWRVPEWHSLVDKMWDRVAELPEEGGDPMEYEIDRHHIAGLVIETADSFDDGFVLYVQGPAKITHPEHEPLNLPSGTFEVRLLPGTSYPFHGDQAD